MGFCAWRNNCQLIVGCLGYIFATRGSPGCAYPAPGAGTLTAKEDHGCVCE